MKMTASQKIARVFEIVGYLWLTPSIISLLYPVIFSIALVLSGNLAGIFISIIPLAIFGLGTVLLVQYYRHSRGLLAEDKIIPLWAGTLVFNLLISLLPAYGFYSTLRFRQHYHPNQDIFIFGWGLLIVWWAAAILMSITAIMSEIKNQKYR
jgi:hypothetical protein